MNRRMHLVNNTYHTVVFIRFYPIPFLFVFLSYKNMLILFLPLKTPHNLIHKQAGSKCFENVSSTVSTKR